ncbi:MAG: LuxR C-terminal-related transcriptional regulator [Rhodoferax sp.]
MAHALTPHSAPPAALDYRLAFDLAPVGMVLSRQRVILDCNQQLCQMFATTRELLLGQSFKLLYPTAIEFERTGARIAPLLNRNGTYADERIMKRLNGETFWCRVNGRAIDPQAPHEAGIWSFMDMSAQRPLAAALTPREREVAAELLAGHTAKQIARALSISHRTVEIHRARLMHKYQAANLGELVLKLMAGATQPQPNTTP